MTAAVTRKAREPWGVSPATILMNFRRHARPSPITATAASAVTRMGRQGPGIRRKCAAWRGTCAKRRTAITALPAKAPRREQALLDVAAICEQLNDEERALGFGKRLLEVNPWGAGTHYQLAKLLAQRRQWQEAIAECRKAVELNPARAEPRVL